jgi:hypothetical protein
MMSFPLGLLAGCAMALLYTRWSSFVQLNTSEVDIIYVITPTYYRSTQIGDLLRLAATLRLVSAYLTLEGMKIYNLKFN